MIEIKNKQGVSVFINDLPKEWSTDYIRAMFDNCKSRLENGMPVIQMAIELISKAIAIHGVDKKNKTPATEAKFSKRGVDEVTHAVYYSLLISPIPIIVVPVNISYNSHSVEENGGKKKARSLIQGSIKFVCPLDDSSLTTDFIAEGLDPTGAGFATVIASAYFIREVFEVIFKIPVVAVDKIKDSVVEDHVQSLIEYMELLTGIEKEAAQEMLNKKLQSSGIADRSLLTNDQAKIALGYIENNLAKKVKQMQSTKEGAADELSNPEQPA